MKLQKIGEKRFQRSNYRIFEQVQTRTNPVRPQNEAYDPCQRRRSKEIVHFPESPSDVEPSSLLCSMFIPLP